MDVIVFVGPTLSAAEARAVIPSAELLPPARRGDVYRACLRRPSIIALIDGYFDHQLSVWHKEILWALARGIRVYGGASMGALRAAELHAFGMVGVGTIFGLFRDGQLEDDDEVAVAHRSEADGYAQLSDSMINIRATLGRAERLEVASRDTLRQVLEIAKATFYPERSLRSALTRARAGGHAVAEVDRLLNFCEGLPGGIIDAKRDDALELLARVRHEAATPPPTLSPRFHFEHTEAWDHFLRQIHGRTEKLERA